MFCGLNGATRAPRRASSRHKPVTSALFPASEVVPCTIKVGVFMAAKRACSPRRVCVSVVFMPVIVSREEM